MFPSFFKKPRQKLLTMNKMNNSYIPLEVVSIIKDYTFYNIESVAFLKKISAKKKELGLIQRAWSRNNIPPWNMEQRFPEEPNKRITEISSGWFFGFTYENIPTEDLFIDNLKLQGEHCLKCGEYTYICYDYKPLLRSKLNICFCN
jgi:hypothetical protein